MKEAQEKAEEWYRRIPQHFHKDMMQDLRAMQKSDEHILHEFVTDAFLYGYLEAHKEEWDKEHNASIRKN